MKHRHYYKLKTITLIDYAVKSKGEKYYDLIYICKCGKIKKVVHKQIIWQTKTKN